jgi:hypothetical protein
MVFGISFMQPCISRAADDGTEYLTPASKKGFTSSSGGIVLKEDKDMRFATKETFKPPVEITIVAKTDKLNLRMGYAADQVIFNWERDPTSLRMVGGPAAGKHKAGAGAIPANKFVTIKWIVTATHQTILVDGEKRYESEDDYSNLDLPVAVYTHKSRVTLQSLKVKKLVPP